MWRRINWKDFIIDCGDAVGGICIGLSFNAIKNLPDLVNKDNESSVLIFGIFLLLSSALLKLYKHKKNE